MLCGLQWGQLIPSDVIWRTTPHLLRQSAALMVSFLGLWSRPKPLAQPFSPPLMTMVLLCSVICIGGNVQVFRVRPEETVANEEHAIASHWPEGSSFLLQAMQDMETMAKRMAMR